jgi:hypothetical protein
VLLVYLQGAHFDDRYGPLMLCAAVVAALTAIFIISCIDFAQVKHAQLLTQYAVTHS